MKVVWCILLAAGFNPTVVTSACTHKEFTVIPPDQYDRNFSSIAEDGKRPLGFMKGILYYDDDTQEKPCIKVTGTSKRRLEIMVETIPVARLCLKTENSPQPTLCGRGQIYQCRQTSNEDSDELNFEFFCDGECSQSDITFWYRFALSAPSSEMDPEMWCDGRDTGEWPSSLQGFIPPGANPKTAPPDGNDINSAVAICRNFQLAVFAALVWFASW